eukprot:154104-Prorocentrum_minimum.AAC.1
MPGGARELSAMKAHLVGTVTVSAVKLNVAVVGNRPIHVKRNKLTHGIIALLGHIFGLNQIRGAHAKAIRGLLTGETILGS